MSQFNYEQYQDVVNKAQNAGSNNNAVKIGFFKLPKDGDEALVRINLSNLNSLDFATVHKPAFGKKFEGLGTGFTPVSCLNEVGSYSDGCPFCKAAAEGNEYIGKAVKSVYVKMLVAYKDAATGQWSAAVPVVWERPAGFSKELAAKLKDYQDLAAHVFKIRRIGTSTDTRYSLDYIPLFDKEDFVPNDFSAFNSFDLSKHSFWVKSAEELQYFVDHNVFKQAENTKSDNLETKPDGSKVGGAPVFANAAEEKAVENALGMQPEVAPVPATEVQPEPKEEKQPREINRSFSF